MFFLVKQKQKKSIVMYLYTNYRDIYGFKLKKLAI